MRRIFDESRQAQTFTGYPPLAHIPAKHTAGFQLASAAHIEVQSFVKSTESESSLACLLSLSDLAYPLVPCLRVEAKPGFRRSRNSIRLVCGNFSRMRLNRAECEAGLRRNTKRKRELGGNILDPYIRKLKYLGI